MGGKMTTYLTRLPGVRLIRCGFASADAAGIDPRIAKVAAIAITLTLTCALCAKAIFREGFA